MKQPFCAPAAALRRVLDAAAALPRPAVETLPLEKACGRIAAKALCARMDQPPFDRSPLDGYALHSADTAGASRETPVTLPVVMKLYAGDAPAAAVCSLLRRWQPLAMRRPCSGSTQPKSTCEDGRSSFFQIAAFLLREGGGVSPATLECRLMQPLALRRGVSACVV